MTTDNSERTIEPILTRWAPAKINLGLHVLRRRDDGFHDIETVMTPIARADHLSVRRAASLHLSCTDPSLPTDENNLVVQAARRLATVAGVEARVHIHLEKHVPHGAGLGGGSSDAAATLLLLKELWDLDVPDAALHEIAAEIGSDVPFFLTEEPAFATGRGEELRRLDYRCPFWAVIVVPPVRISTREAYQLVTPRGEDRPDLVDIVTSNDIARWRRALRNDFEPAILERYPQVAQAKADLLEAGAGYASLSGSGSAVYGLFEEEKTAQQSATALQGEGHIVWAGRL